MGFLSYWSISYISLILVFLLSLWFIKEPKNTYGYWKKQPMQKKKGKFPKKITEDKPKVYKQTGFAVKEIYHWTPDFISSFSPEIYQTMCRDNNAKVLCLVDTRRNNIPVGFIYGQKQSVSGEKMKEDKEVVYVSGLYLLREYRNKGLSSILISNLIGKWWDKCKQFVFLHDKQILENTIKPIQEKEIYIFSPWMFWSYEHNPKTKLFRSQKRYISFYSPKNDNFLIKNFGAIYHIHGHTAYIHEMIEDNDFEMDTLMKISTKHPWLLWIYVPKEFCTFKGSGSYKRYIYGYNMKGGGEKKPFSYGVYDI